MTDFRRVTDQLSVSPQIGLDDVAEAAKAGYRTLINNRPDGEAPGQPTSAEMASAAAAAGMAYAYIPVRGVPTPEQVDEAREAVDASDGPVLMYCRSGTRSIITWSVGQALSGARTRPELIELGGEAGYDLSQILLPS